jgi:hypothetical protein
MTSRLRLRSHVQHETLRGPAPAADAGSLATAAASVSGLTFEGIAEVQTAQGTMPMLKFTMSSMTLSGGTSLTFGLAGHSMVTRATSLAITGHVVLYATEICGDMGGVPVTFTPQHPPARLGPGITLTNVRAEQPYVSADTVAGSELGIAGEPAS